MDGSGVSTVGGGSAAPAEPAKVLAPAKLNLSLHVVGRRTDGYHLLRGLVAFAEAGDSLTISEAATDRVEVDGPFAEPLQNAPNILTSALALARAVAAEHGVAIPLLAVRLTKALPVASGLGGGSADAAALLGYLAHRWPSLRNAIEARAVTLGADVPMCLAGRPASIDGIGEVLTPLAALPGLPAILVNPRVPMSTAAVYAGLARADNASPPPVPAGGFGDVGSLVAHLEACRNDLEPVAERLDPVIRTVRDKLLRGGALFARMSGSGATVFGLYRDGETLARAAEAIRRERPGWWIAETRLRGTHEEVIRS